MLEFRFHGRGGQGVVMLNKLVARLFFRLDKHVKEFPKFGVERRGAPVEGYVRVDDSEIDLNCQIYNPDVIIVMAESMLDTVDVTAGMAPGGLILIDSGRSPETFAEQLAGFKVVTFDASGVALSHGLGNRLAPISNTTLFGAFAKLMDVPRDEVAGAIEAELKRAGRNPESALVAYDTVSAPVLLGGDVVRPEPKPAPYATLDDLPDLAYSTSDALGNKTGRWRSSRPQYSFKVAPCNSLCPAGNDVRGFLQAMADGSPTRALSILLETSPFPGVCGRVCPHPCETECNRESMDGAVPVMALERLAASQADELRFATPPETGKRVAVIGAGPGGLSAAWQLVKRGHEVVVYEAAPEPGGMLLLGIPSFRLPRDILRDEIGRIMSLGVEIRCNKKVGDGDGELRLSTLLEEFDSVIIATGMPVSTKLGLPGEDGVGVEHGLEMLTRHNLGNEVSIGDKVIVIGGGNTAVDVAGVVLRKSQTRDVSIVYRRTREQMPAIPEEVEVVLEEGAKIEELMSPAEVLVGDGGAVRAVLCDVMRLGAPDKSGRPRPEKTGKQRELPCDQVFLATGQAADLDFAGSMVMGDDQATTNIEHLFVCGDVATEVGTVTAAIGSGRLTANKVHAFLGYHVDAPKLGWAPTVDEVLRFDRIRPHHFAAKARGTQPRLDVEARLNSFDEVVGDLAEGCGEAVRCLACGSCNGCDNCYTWCPEPAVTRKDGVYTIDMAYCKGCGICFEECPRGVIDIEAEGVGERV